MTTRIVVGLVALPLVLVPVWLGGVWVLLLVLFIASLAGYEFFAMMRKGGFRPNMWLGISWLLLIILHFGASLLPNSLAFLQTFVALPLIFNIGLFLTLFWALFQTEKPLLGWMSTCLGAVYIGFLSGQILSLRLLENGLWWLILGIFITWMNDTTAYFTGVTIGRNKLWPRLSPKKTWEGTVAGWLGAALVGGLLTWLSPLHAGFLFGFWVGAIGGVFALLGDLSVSMFKRQVGVKDSGWLFPGHGGMLDRMDSILFVLPFIYQVVTFLG